MTTHGPLNGIRVIEAGRFASAPSCATVLADWGADVIKLEPPRGDPARGPGSLAPSVDGPSVNPRFDVHNRTRRSVSLDLLTEGGQDVAHRLIRTADVFVTNMRPSALTRLGLDSVTLRAADPRLIYAQVTGYGKGEAENWRSYDHGAFWSYSGLAHQFRDADGTPPQPAGGMGDRATGSALAGAVGAALFARERTGQGSHVSASLLRTAMWLMASDAADALHRDGVARPNNRHAAPIPTVNCFRSSDGRWIWLQSMHPDHDWEALIDALDARWLDEDPRFRGGDPRQLAQSSAAVVDALDEIFRQRTLSEWSRRLSVAGITFAPVQELSDAVRDPIVVDGGSIRRVPLGDSHYDTVNSPCTFEDVVVDDSYPAPGVGEHTHQVLAEIGLTTTELEALQTSGAFGTAAV